MEFVYLIAVFGMSFGWLNRRYYFEVPRTQSFTKVLIGYVLLRIALFDFIWNIAAGQSLDYIGFTKIYDQVQTAIVNMWGFSTLVFIKSILAFWGLAWLIPWGNKEQ